MKRCQTKACAFQAEDGSDLCVYHIRQEETLSTGNPLDKKRSEIVERIKTEVSPELKTVADMLRALQQEIDEVKSGKMSVEGANVIAKFRNLQIRTVEIALKAQRLSDGGMERRIPEGRLLGGKP